MKWTIGDTEVFQIIEMEGGELIQESIKDATPENIRKIEWLQPNFADKQGNLKGLVQSFLIKSNSRNILVDTCNGNGKVRPTCPTWGNLNTNFLDKFKDLGVNVKDIDIVVCTHLHFDHVGWNTQLKDGKWTPTFSNAKYLFVEEDYEYWKQKPEREVDDDKFAFDDSIVPIVEAGLSQFIKTNHKIDDNINLMPTPGHTPGHVSVSIESQGKRAVISGDFIHHPCQFAHPEWPMGADALPDQAQKTRSKVLNELVDDSVLFIGTHFSNPVAGYIKRSGNSFIFEV